MRTVMSDLPLVLWWPLLRVIKEIRKPRTRTTLRPDRRFGSSHETLADPPRLVADAVGLRQQSPHPTVVPLHDGKQMQSVLPF